MDDSLLVSVIFKNNDDIDGDDRIRNSKTRIPSISGIGFQRRSISERSMFALMESMKAFHFFLSQKRPKQGCFEW